VSGTHLPSHSVLVRTWTLATLRIPTIVIYLGFIGDTEMKDASQTLRRGSGLLVRSRRILDGVVHSINISYGLLFRLALLCLAPKHPKHCS